jgi:preprotein translocase subunit SecD
MMLGFRVAALAVAIAAGAVAVPVVARGQDSIAEPRHSRALDAALSVRGLSLEYRWVLPDRTPRAESPYRDPSNGMPLVLDDTVAFDLTGAEGVRVSDGRFGGTVALRLTEFGAQRLLRTTTEHQGQSLAVLVNRRVVTVARIMSPLAALLPVASDLPSAQAAELADRLKAAIRH